MNRPQQRLDLVLIPLDNFCEPYSTTEQTTPTEEHNWRTLHGTVSEMQVIYSQTSTSYINVHDLLNFIEITETTVTFIWASEETGFRHLYLITSSLIGAVNGVKKVTDVEHFDCGFLVPRIINKVALTSGDWEVLGKSMWVDSTRQLIYFLGLKESPLEKHLYAVSLQQPGHMRLLTTPGYSYSIEFNDECTLLIQVYCNIQRLPTCEVLKITQNCPSGGVGGISLTSMGYLLEGGPTENPQYCPSIYSPRLTNGETLYSMVFKPHNFTLGVKYPTVLNIYGGPEVQTVSNTFKVRGFFVVFVNFVPNFCFLSGNATITNAYVGSSGLLCDFN